MRKFAVFDIDGTVIRWQLYHSVVSELARQGKLSADAEQQIHDARMIWKQREHSESFRTYEHVVVQLYQEALTSLKVSDHAAAVDKVFDEYKDQVYVYTRDLIANLKQQGYLLFAVSGSQQEIVSKLASYYGFDDAMGTQLEQKDGYFTGNVETPALGKQKSLDTLLARHDITHEASIAVGDSESDIPLFEAVEKPIVFNPTKGLFAHAQTQHWPIVVERKNMIYKLEPHNGSYILA